jgi:hypothetical protein
MFAFTNRAARAVLVLLLFVIGCSDSRATKLTREWVWDWPGGKTVYRFDTDGYYTLESYRKGASGTYYAGSQKYTWALDGKRLKPGGDPHDLIVLTDQELRYKHQAGFEYVLRPINDTDRQEFRTQSR